MNSISYFVDFRKAFEQILQAKPGWGYRQVLHLFEESGLSILKDEYLEFFTEFRRVYEEKLKTKTNWGKNDALRTFIDIGLELLKKEKEGNIQNEG